MGLFDRFFKAGKTAAIESTPENSAISKPDSGEECSAEVWEAHYANLLADSSKFAFERKFHDQLAIRLCPQLVKLMKRMVASNRRKVWFPGCGLDAMPKLFAQVGFDVLATDIAQSAIEYQASSENDVTDLAFHYRQMGAPSADREGTFRAEIHDFLLAKQPEFDLVFNFRSFQGFKNNFLPRIAQVHHGALKNGGIACFCMLNVPGKRQALLEQTLSDAGYVVPGLELNKWFAKALRDSKVDFVFVNGLPAVPQTSAYMSNPIRYEEDCNKIANLIDVYKRRAAEEAREEEECQWTERKRAVIIYSSS